MKLPQTVLHAFALPSVCLIVLSGCAGLRKFPATYIYEYDRKENVCGQYQITSTRPKLTFKHVADQPVSWCGGMFGFSTQDTPKVLDWMDEAQAVAEKRCK